MRKDYYSLNLFSLRVAGNVRHTLIQSRNIMAKTKVVLTVLLLTFALGTRAQLKEQFRELLEQYCMEYYDSCFDHRQYVEGSLIITKLEANEADDAIKVRGKHSYKGQYIPFYGRKTHSYADFKAEIRVTCSGMEIRFWKGFEPDVYVPRGRWEGPCEKTITLTYHEK